MVAKEASARSASLGCLETSLPRESLERTFQVRFQLASLLFHHIIYFTLVLLHPFVSSLLLCFIRTQHLGLIRACLGSSSFLAFLLDILQPYIALSNWKISSLRQPLRFWHRYWWFTSGHAQDHASSLSFTCCFSLALSSEPLATPAFLAGCLREKEQRSVAASTEPSPASALFFMKRARAFWTRRFHA